VITAEDERACRSMALPAIGCGARRFPPEIAAEHAVGTVEDELISSGLELVCFVFPTASLRDEYQAVGAIPK